MSVIAALLVAGAAGAPIAFDRVDIVSEMPGTWIHYELPQLGVYPTSAALRWLEQVQVVATTPIEGLNVGLSLAAQSALFERPLPGGLGLSFGAGLQTRLLLPRGVSAGLAWRVWHLRLGLGISVLSDASWAHLDWTFWRVLPTIGIGFGRRAP